MMNRMNEITKESDLYLPIKQFLESNGYDVKGEVKDCDIVAIKDDQMLVVELKLNLNLDVILQSTLRQKLADVVFIGVPMSRKVYNSKRFKNICYLLRRLEIGLLLVTKKNNRYAVRMELDSLPFDMDKSKKQNKRHKRLLQKEFNERHGDNNVGGVTGKKLVTVYRENALTIVGLLLRHGNLSAKELKKLGASDNTYNILYNNHYGWFERVEKGIYGLTDKGILETKQYEVLIEKMLDQLNTIV